MAAYYLWIKALHVAFMVTWFAGLFYLPRLFIYHAEADDSLSRDRFVIMERRLFGIMTIGAIITLVAGLALLVGLGLFHVACHRWMRRLKDGYRSERTANLRWFNEIPVVFLLGIIGLAVVKPF